MLKKEHDGSISRDNKAWAKTIPMPEDGGDPRHSYVLVVDKVNPGLTVLFLKQAGKSFKPRRKAPSCKNSNRSRRNANPPPLRNGNRNDERGKAETG